MKKRGQYKGQKWAMQGVNANLKDPSKPIYFTINGVDDDYMSEYNYYEALANIKRIIDEEIVGTSKDIRYAKGEAPNSKEVRTAKATKVKRWYVENYPTDDLGREIDSDLTFWQLWVYLSQGDDIYSVLGVTDSLVRERVFEGLSEVLDVDYDVVYDKWLRKTTYAKGGEVVNMSNHLVFRNDNGSYQTLGLLNESNKTIDLSVFAPKELRDKAIEWAKNNKYSVRKEFAKGGRLRGVMKNIDKHQAPFTIVVVEDGRVIHQDIGLNDWQLIPAYYRLAEENYPNAEIRVEDSTGASFFKNGGKIGDKFVGQKNSNYNNEFDLYKNITSYVIDSNDTIHSIHNTPMDAINERNRVNPNWKLHFDIPKKEKGGSILGSCNYYEGALSFLNW